MLDPDISTADALALCTRPSTDAWAVDRRRFLQLIGMGARRRAAARARLDRCSTSCCSATTRRRGRPGPSAPTDGILVVIGMFGGNDGLNMVVPINDGPLLRPARRARDPRRPTLPPRRQLRLNKALTEFKRFWDAGQLAVVQGVGYPNPDFSHFNSMANWMAGQLGGIPSSGWVGRWLDGYLGGDRTCTPPPRSGTRSRSIWSGRVQRGTVGAGQPARLRRRHAAPATSRSINRCGRSRRLARPVARARRPGLRRPARPRRRRSRRTIRRRACRRASRGPARGRGPADQRQPRFPGAHRRLGRLRQPRQPARHAHRRGWRSSTQQSKRFFEILDPAWSAG